MKQGVLPFQYEEEKSSTGMTALSGLPAYLELAHAAGLRSSLERHVGLRRCGQGWTDIQVLTSLIMLNPVSSTGQALAGGESVIDLDVLEEDEGFCRVLIPFHIAEAVKCAGRLRVECSIQSQAVSDRTRPGSDSSSPRYASTASIFSSMLPYVLPSTHLRTSWNTRSAGFNSGLYGGWMMVASPTLRTISPR